MNVFSISLLIALVVFAYGQEEQQHELEYPERGRGDVTGLMRSGWERLKGASKQTGILGQDDKKQNDSEEDPEEDQEDNPTKGRADVSGSVRSGLQRLKGASKQKGIFGRSVQKKFGVKGDSLINPVNIKKQLKKPLGVVIKQKISQGLNYPISQIVHKHGYPFEEHEVVTPDGYILLIHRIPHGRQQQMSGTMKRMPVFLQHGLLSSSDSWLLNEPEISLPYLLADAGFDVWMGNTRGNIYGRRHRTMTPTQPEFWNFSWDDIARHDVPTMVNYVVKLTDVPAEKIKSFGKAGESSFKSGKFGGKEQLKLDKTFFGGDVSEKQKYKAFGGKENVLSKQFPFEIKMNPKGKLHYIGHSEGSLLGFVQFGRDKDLASKITVFIALSPIANIGSGQSPVSSFLKTYDLSNVFSEPEVLSNEQFRNYLKNNICVKGGFFDELCRKLIYSLANPSGTVESQRIPFYFSKLPAGSSRKNLLHYSQLAKSGKLQGFDYGSQEKNQFYHKQNVPPQYKLSDVNVPVVLFYGKKDWLVSDKDFQNLKQNLPNIIYQDLIDTFGHLDFVLSKKAKDQVYDKIIKLLHSQKY